MRLQYEPASEPLQKKTFIGWMVRWRRWYRAPETGHAGARQVDGLLRKSQACWSNKEEDLHLLDGLGGGDELLPLIPSHSRAHTLSHSPTHSLTHALTHSTNKEEDLHQLDGLSGGDELVVWYSLSLIYGTPCH